MSGRQPTEGPVHRHSLPSSILVGEHLPWLLATDDLELAFMDMRLFVLNSGICSPFFFFYFPKTYCVFVCISV